MLIFAFREINCQRCRDTGVIETGNNDLPCSCPAGETAKFNIVEADGPVTGAELRRHFLNDSPEPIGRRNGKPFPVAELPGRQNATS